MLNFTLKQLRYVAAAGREGSIANVATSLNISQSSITAAIDALEAGSDIIYSCAALQRELIRPLRDFRPLN